VVLAVAASDLLEVIWVSLAAGIGITLAFSLVVLGSARSTEARRSGHSAASTAYAVLAGAALVGFAAAVVLGVNIMLSK
jgi:hypothetical protein